jgi:hypothetical protein
MYTGQWILRNVAISTPKLIMRAVRMQALWDLNPRPQQCQQEVDHYTNDKVQSRLQIPLTFSTFDNDWHKSDKKVCHNHHWHLLEVEVRVFD